MSEKKVWFITGAGRSMGADFGKAALQAGHAVVATGRDPERVAEALGHADNVLAVKLDVTSHTDAEAAVRAAVERFGRIDVLPNAGANAPDRAYGGNPAGFVVIVANGPTIYHSRDTAYLKDMETVGESYAIAVALLNIGGHYGMEPKMAAKAAESLRAKLAVPHHFGTFPGIAQTAEVFASELARRKLRFHEMQPGQTMTFRGREIVKAKTN